MTSFLKTNMKQVNFFLTWKCYLLFRCVWKLLDKAKFSEILLVVGAFLTFSNLRVVLCDPWQQVEIYKFISDGGRFLEAVRDIKRVEDLCSFCWHGLETSFFSVEFFALSIHSRRYLQVSSLIQELKPFFFSGLSFLYLAIYRLS